MLRHGYVIYLCVVATIVACDRDTPDPEFTIDGGRPGRDGGTPPPRGGRGGDAGTIGGRTGGSGRAAGGSGGFIGVAGSGTAGSGFAGSWSAGAGAPDPGIDCSEDNGGCGDEEYIQCIPSGNGGYCLDRNECTINNGGCDPHTYCINVHAGPPNCGPCPSGFEQDDDGACTDIDECAIEDNPPCNSEHMICTNYPGYYNCDDRLECMTDNGGCGDAEEFFCIEQYNMASTCKANECFNNGSCGSRDTSRCVDRPDITAFCVGKVADVSVAENICVLRADQAVDCLGFEGNILRYGNRYTKIAAGQGFLCGINASGGLHCETQGQPEIGSVPSGSDFTAIAVGYYHGCGLRMGGTAACWGADQGGSVSRPHFETSLSGIAASAYGTCVLRTAGTIECFGAEADAAFRDVNEDGGSDFIAIYMGSANVCALHADNTAECWGDNSAGQVTGIGQASSTKFTSLSIGEGTICGLRMDKTVRCWGYDEYGQASGPNGAEGDVASISAGVGRTCLVFTDGTFRCYGAELGTTPLDPWVRPAAE